MQTIPGVALSVFKQDRPLAVEDDGFVGELASGYAVIMTRVAPGASCYALLQQARDQYAIQKDHALSEDVTDGTKLYRLKTVLEAGETGEPFVSYPNNMLCIAEYGYDPDADVITDTIRLWKVAIVSQHGKFFLTVQPAYDVTIFRADESGKLCIPRLVKHPTLEAALLRLLPDTEWRVRFPQKTWPKGQSRLRETDPYSGPARIEYPLSAYEREPQPEFPCDLGSKEGFVLSYYEARGIGTVLTEQGVARVSWMDLPPRPRRRYLVPGETIRFRKIGKPFLPKKTEYRPGRVSRFERQVFGISIPNGHMEPDDAELDREHNGVVAGPAQGVGSHRPNKGDNGFGQFEVVSES